MEEEESKIMGLKQDFVLRRLEDQGRFLARLILGKDEAHYELPEYEAMDNRADALYRKLLALVDNGEINEAENILLDELDTGDLNMFEMALCFYLYLAHLDEDFLEEHRYTMEEIGEGMEALAEDFGVSGFEISMGK